MIQPPDILPLVILILGLGVLGLLTRKGCLRREALDAGPSRKIGLVPADLLIAFGLMIFGPALVMMLMPESAAGQTDPGAARAIDTLAYAHKALLAQAAGQLPPVLYLLWRSTFTPRGPWLIGLVTAKPWRDLRWGVWAFFAAVPMVMATIQVAVYTGEVFGQEAPVLAHDMLKMLVDSDSHAGTVLIIVSAVLVAPILEESIFRGVIQSVMVETLGESRRWAVVIVASILFMLMHADTSSWENWQALPGLCVLGLVLGWLYERSGSLWPSIIVHMGFNAMNILMALATTVSPESTP